jgi:hypothetical protein
MTRLNCCRSSAPGEVWRLDQILEIEEALEELLQAEAVAPNWHFLACLEAPERQALTEKFCEFLTDLAHTQARWQDFLAGQRRRVEQTSPNCAEVIGKTSHACLVA